MYPLAARTVLALLLVIAVAGCSSGDGTTPNADELASTAPAASDLLCDLAPADSVNTAIGTADYRTQGQLSEDQNFQRRYGSCTLRDEDGEILAQLRVRWPSSDWQEQVRDRVENGPTDYLYPDGIVGYATHVRDDEGDDAPLTGGAAAMIWGDYVVQVTLHENIPDRDALRDAVALTHQIVDALALTDESSQTSE